jgi:hypothetical protein
MPGAFHFESYRCLCDLLPWILAHPYELSGMTIPENENADVVNRFAQSTTSAYSLTGLRTGQPPFI